jgi:hypothetical protein
MQYRFPRHVLPITVHGTSREKARSVEEYLHKQCYAFAADLLCQGFLPDDIEDAVTRGVIRAAQWPADQPQLEVYWSEGSPGIRELDQLALEAVRICEEDGLGRNFDGVGTKIGLHLAQVVFTYARAKGMVREIRLPHEWPPLYIVKGGALEQLIDQPRPQG